MSQLHVSAAPHIHSGNTTTRVMRDVMIALLPAAIASVVLFGMKSLVLIAACMISCVACEWIFNKVAGKKCTCGDLSAAVTGLLLALNLSTNVPVWQCVVGSAFAIIIVKCMFGGIGRNIVNPAIAARVFMLVAFSEVAGGAACVLTDATTSATPLETLAPGAEGLPTMMELFLGMHGGTIGETCAAALLIGFAYLLIRKVIKWHVPVIFVGTVFVLTLVYSGFDVVYAVQHVLTGGLLLGAIFMATDYVTAPVNLNGRIVFAVGCGLITFVIREFCAYPEGVSFSILFMNLLTPLIEEWTDKEPLGGI
ncbi:MAG: RnfABCDGE type electron transport complex subunit D [Firmicutes bacterium]|nr:RnfABCDGE type electron transport complex subunit D [Bacillota bacterium]